MHLPTIRSLFAHKLQAVRPARRKSPRLRLECLEARTVPSTLTVDDDRGQNKHAQFTSIQAAVNSASPGDTIKVYAGEYREQVTIPNNLNGLRLIAVGGKDGHDDDDHDDHDGHGSRDNVIIDPAAFTTANRAIVEDAGAENVEIRGFLITGRNAPAGAGQGAFYGVLVDNGGSATVRDNHITFIRDQALSGNQQGVGIMFGLKDNANNVLSSGSGTARNNLVDNYQKGGIVVAGAGSSAAISGNTVKGVGLTPVIAQNGIQVSNGASADVTNNTVSGNQFQNPPNTPPDGGFESEGILIDTAGQVRVRDNFAFANDEGIAVYFTDGVLVENNTANGNTLNGILFANSNNGTVRKNDTEFNQNDGIGISASNGNLIEGNTAAHNANFGIEVDDGSTGNTIRKNRLFDNGENLFVEPGNTVEDNNFGESHHHGHHGHHGHHNH